MQTAEVETYDYRIYVGIDEGDKLAMHATSLEKMSSAYIQILPIIVPGSDSFTKCINHIAKVAYGGLLERLVAWTRSNRCLLRAGLLERFVAWTRGFLRCLRWSYHQSWKYSAFLVVI